MKHHQRTEGRNDEWLTPPEIFNALGGFDLDPASVELKQGETLPWPMATMNISPSMDGLRDEWWKDYEFSGRKLRVWLNPPFNRYERPKWMKKMADHGNGIMLIPAATETKAFMEHVWKKADAVCFVYGRPHFYVAADTTIKRRNATPIFIKAGRRAPFNCGTAIVLVAYGEANAAILEQAKLGKYIHL